MAIIKDGVDVTEEILARYGGKGDSLERNAQRIIENIWKVWYGENRGRMTSDGMSDLLCQAKREIIMLAKTSDGESK